MKWTKDKPIKVGYYWYRLLKRETSYIVEVKNGIDGLIIFEDGDIYDFEWYEGYFSDKPIERPEED